MLGQGPEPEVQTNLFKILCAILNTKPNQRGSNRLQDETLQRYLSRIDQPSVTFEENLIQQILTIKNLINRKAYTMTEEQITQIHKKFKTLAHYRNFRSVQRPFSNPRQQVQPPNDSRVFRSDFGTPPNAYDEKQPRINSKEQSLLSSNTQ